jgi:hypothetical protein
MAKVVLGILDGFIGKVGTVVGSYWKGKPVMRGYKRIHHDSKSEKQLLIRTRFGALAKLAEVFLPVLQMGFYKVARQKVMTEGNIFIRKNWEMTHSTVPGIATIDYPELVISAGKLHNVDFGTPSFDNPLEVEVTYSTVSPLDDSNDLVYIFAYSPDANEGLLSESAKRDTGRISLTVPSHWNGLKVHVWGLTQSATSDTTVSDSSYIGTGNIG